MYDQGMDWKLVVTSLNFPSFGKSKKLKQVLEIGCLD